MSDHAASPPILFAPAPYQPVAAPPAAAAAAASGPTSAASQPPHPLAANAYANVQVNVNPTPPVQQQKEPFAIKGQAQQPEAARPQLHERMMATSVDAGQSTTAIAHPSLGHVLPFSQ